MNNQTHILVIDDHEDTVTLLEDFLGDNGFHVTTALDGQSGLNQIVEKRPDLILLDMALPDMSGADVCTQLRTNPATRDIPIIVCTAHKVSLEEKMKGFRAGVDDYLIRPFELAELLARIQAVLRRSQARPKADVLADIQSLLKQPSKREPAPKITPTPQTIIEKKSEAIIKPEPMSLDIFKRWWEVLNFPSRVFAKPRYSHDFFTALFFVLLTPMIASLSKISDKSAGFDGWIGAFSLGIMTNLIMWFATAGLIHLALPFHGINLTMRRSLSVSGLAWAPRLLGALFSASYGLLPFVGIGVPSQNFTTGLDVFFNIGATTWIKTIGHVGLFDAWSTGITLVAVWAIIRAEKKWTAVPLLIGITCLAFGAFTHY